MLEQSASSKTVQTNRLPPEPITDSLCRRKERGTHQERGGRHFRTGRNNEGPRYTRVASCMHKGLKRGTENTGEMGFATWLSGILPMHSRANASDVRRAIPVTTLRKAIHCWTSMTWRLLTESTEGTARVPRTVFVSQGAPPDYLQVRGAAFGIGELIVGSPCGAGFARGWWSTITDGM